jgi:RNA polymerase sigma factor (sigma-70 family)
MLIDESERWRQRFPRGDEQLARMVAQGNQWAFATLYERHRSALYRYCRLILRVDADAQDAVQSTFARALAALQDGKRDAPIRPWLFRIAHNEAVSLIRRRRTADELSAALRPFVVSADAPGGELEQLGALVADLGDLPEQQRAALLMRELYGLSHGEIGVALKVSTGAAKQLIFAARTTLAEFEKGRTMGCDSVRRIVSDGDRRVLRGRRVRSHLRECAACAAFAAATPMRRRSLRALVPPLAPFALTRVFARMARTIPVHRTRGGGAAGVAASALVNSSEPALTLKMLVGAVFAAGAVTGISGTLPGSQAAGGSRAVAQPTSTAGVAGSARSGRAPSALRWVPGLHSQMYRFGGGAAVITGDPAPNGPPVGWAAPGSRRAGAVPAGRGTAPVGRGTAPVGGGTAPVGGRAAPAASSGVVGAPPSSAAGRPGSPGRSNPGESRGPDGGSRQRARWPGSDEAVRNPGHDGSRLAPTRVPAAAPPRVHGALPPAISNSGAGRDPVGAPVASVPDAPPQSPGHSSAGGGGGPPPAVQDPGASAPGRRQSASASPSPQRWWQARPAPPPAQPLSAISAEGGQRPAASARA